MNARALVLLEQLVMSDALVRQQIRECEAVQDRITRDIALLVLELSAGGRDMPAVSDTAPSNPCQAITRALVKQGSDLGEGSGGRVGARVHEGPESDQKTAVEAQTRNEPGSVETVASGGGEGAARKAAPSPVRRERVTRSAKAERDAKIAERLRNGEEASVIARLTGLSPVTVRAIRREFGIPAKHPNCAVAVPAAEKVAQLEEQAARVDKNLAALERIETLEPEPEPAPVPYSKPLDPVAAQPIPQADLPAPIPVLDVGAKVMVVEGLLVHGPLGTEDRFGPRECAILAHIADGELYPNEALAAIAKQDNGALTYLIGTMRPKLAAIGVEIYRPNKFYWRARRLGS